MINVITYKHHTPTWPLPTNTNVPKHTQNSYGMCYLHTTNIFLPTLLVILFFILFKQNYVSVIFCKASFIFNWKH